jgi:hypothetical protein
VTILILAFEFLAGAFLAYQVCELASTLASRKRS